ncbi:hypothetical protein CBL_01917 [Carabus blaptoides fortunei]
MEHEDEFLHQFFTYISKLCFDKTKEHVEKERESCRNSQLGSWSLLLAQLPQIALAEKSYIELGFLQNKNKGFLRKDNSLRAIYESLRSELYRLEDSSKNGTNNRNITSFFNELAQFLSARIDLIDFYEKVHQVGASRQMKHNELLTHIDEIIERHALLFSHISLTPIKAIFSLECEILAKLLKAFIELRNLKFLPTLALIYGAHTRLTAWESTLQNRESWKLGFLKNNPLPALFQWLMRLRGAVLSKFSLYFYSTLAQQVASNDMRQLCSKLHYDHYQKMSSFQRRYDAASVLLISDKPEQINGSNRDDNSQLIVSCPVKPTVYLENVLKLVLEKSVELNTLDRIVFYQNIMDQCTYTLSLVEPNIYLAIVFESKKTEKDLYIKNFMSELVLNLRCSKIFASIKNSSK